MPKRVAALLASVSMYNAALADIGSADLRFDAAEAIALGIDLESRSQDQELADGAPPARFATASDRWWLGYGGGLAFLARDSDVDINAYASLSRFIADQFEFTVEGAGWYLMQDDDAAAVNVSMIFRWHFTVEPENADWTGFIDTGIGVLYASERVAGNGTQFNFTPRAGLGMTRRIGDTESRWLLGLRWQHMSNARIEGGDRNPGRDAVMVYAGFIVPF